MIDGSIGTARFHALHGIAFDASGTLFVVDTHTIRSVTPAGQVTTFAGSISNFGNLNATGSNARFKAPGALAVDNNGLMYIADYGNRWIRTATADGNVGLFATSLFPQSVAVSDDGRAIYYADSNFKQVIKINVATHAMSTLGSYTYPTDLKVDSSGNVYVVDFYNDTIRKIATDGTQSLIAGEPNTPGNTDGIGSAARFHTPNSIALDAQNNLLYVMEYDVLRKINLADNSVSTVAGMSGSYGFADATGDNARFNYAYSVAVDPATGNLYVADTNNHVIRKVTPAGVVTTVVGQPGVGSFQSGALPGLIAFPQYVIVSGNKLFISMDNAVVVVTPLP